MEVDAMHVADRLKEIAEREIASGAPAFMGKPDRWYESPHWRCANDHVLDSYLKSDGLGDSVCFRCFETVYLTFPEDRDGELQVRL